jgi:iron complex outermembrane recepter protein
MASILVLRGVRAARARGALAITAASMLGWLNTADAQQSTPAAGNTLEEVVVTGIRHSIETSIATKRESTSIIEVVSAEDIGKLPDTSIADSLARLPGLAAQRIDGRPAAISIRGLGEDYAGALLNGRQVVSSSEGRSAEYDQFPSELVNQVIVYKTVDAGVVGQGLSGTIDIRPLMPLSLNRRTIGLSARAEQNGNGGLSSTGKGDRGYRFSASYVNQFADDKIGLALGYAHLDSPGQAKKYGAWAFGDYTGQWGATNGGVPLADGSGTCDTDPNTVEDCAVFQQGFEASATSSKQARDGAIGILEFRPNDSFSSVVDLYYSKFEQDRVGHHWVGDIGLWSGGGTFSNVGTKEVDGNTIIDSGTVSGSKSLVYNKNWDRGDKIRSIGWRNTLELTDQWTGTLDVGYSRADRDETYIQSVARANELGSLNFSNSGEPDHTSWSTPQDLTDPNLVQLTNDPNWAEMRTPKFKDEIKSAQLSINRSLNWGWFGSLDAGVAYNQRDKNVSSDAFLLTLTGAANQGVPFQAIPTDALRDSVLIDVAGIHQRVLSWNVPSIMGLYTITPKDPWLAQTNKFKVHEKVKTAFTKLNIDTPLGDMRVRGNVGVQFVDTEQNSDGFAWNDDGGSTGGPPGGAILPVHGGADYSDVLPSLNLVVELQEDLILRFGLGKTMARPRMDDMRAGADQPQLTEIQNNPGFGTWSASGGGNPEIRPWRAKSVDLSLEKYFGQRSYVALGGFLKKLDTFIYERTTTRDFSSFTNYNPDLVPGCDQADPDCDPNIGTFTTQNNGSGGKVYGLEAAASLDAGVFTPMLDGFGIFASTANTKNSLPKDEDGNEINLDGFSSTVNSFGAYYERGGFSARVSRYHRSSFTATTRSVLLGTLRSTRIDAESQMDAQISYAFDSGMFEGLTLLLQGNNLTNERAITRQSPETVGSVGQSNGLLPWVDDNYGRVLLLGASYKF